MAILDVRALQARIQAPPHPSTPITHSAWSRSRADMPVREAFAIRLRPQDTSQVHTLVSKYIYINHLAQGVHVLALGLLSALLGLRCTPWKVCTSCSQGVHRIGRVLTLGKPQQLRRFCQAY